MLLNRNNLSVVKISSKEGGRYAWNGVYLDTDGGTVATDGKRLLHCSAVEDDEEEYPSCKANGFDYRSELEKPVILSQDTVKKVTVNIPKKVFGHPILENCQVHTDADEKEFHLVSTDLETETRVKARLLEGEFPKWKEVVPSGQADMSLVVDSELLYGLLKVMADSMKMEEKKIVKFEFFGSDRPVKLSCKADTGQTMTGAIMPIK